MSRSTLTAAAFLLVVTAGPGAAPEEDALAAIKKAGGEAVLDEKRPGMPIIAVNL